MPVQLPERKQPATRQQMSPLVVLTPVLQQMLTRPNKASRAGARHAILPCSFLSASLTRLIRVEHVFRSICARAWNARRNLPKVSGLQIPASDMVVPGIAEGAIFAVPAQCTMHSASGA